MQLGGGAATLFGLIVLVVLVSPILLAGVFAIFSGLRWDQLSAVGQSYTGISAVLSAAALIAATSRRSPLVSVQIDRDPLYAVRCPLPSPVYRRGHVLQL